MAGLLLENSKGELSSAPACPPLAELTVQQYTTEEVTAPAFTAAWAELTRSAATPNPFFEYWNLVPALQLLRPQAEITVFTVHSKGQLIGLIPLERSSQYYGHRIPHLRVWLHANAFSGVPLVRAGSEHDFWTGLLNALDSDRSTAIMLHLKDLPASNRVTKALFSVLGQQDRAGSIVTHEERALLKSTCDSQTYLEQSMRGKKRKELRRQARRLGELGTVETRRTNGEDDLAEWTGAFLALEHAGWKGAAGSSLLSDASKAAYFIAALKGGAKAGKLECLSIKLNDKPIAMLATFLSPPGSFAFKTAYDEAFSRFSPGVLLQQENLALLDHPDIAWCDSCASADHPMIERIWREKQEVLGLNIALGGALKRQIFKLLSMAERSAKPIALEGAGPC